MMGKIWVKYHDLKVGTHNANVFYDSNNQSIKADFIVGKEARQLEIFISKYEADCISNFLWETGKGVTDSLSIRTDEIKQKTHQELAKKIHGFYDRGVALKHTESQVLDEILDYVHSIICEKKHKTKKEVGKRG